MFVAVVCRLFKTIKLQLVNRFFFYFLLYSARESLCNVHLHICILCDADDMCVSEGGFFITASTRSNSYYSHLYIQ